MPVDPLQQILSQIRTALAARTQRGAGAGRLSDAAPRQSAEPTQELRAQLRAGISGLNLCSADGRTAARRLFLESVLLSEFGARLANDPRFTQIVGQIQNTFEEQERLRQDLDRVLDELSRSAG